MGAATIQQMADRIAALLEERLRIPGKGLEAKLRSAGRILPRGIRQAGRRLAEAAAMAQNPKLLPQVDEGKVAADYDLCLRHLSGLSLWERRRTAVTATATSIIFILLAVALLTTGVLHWRGLI
jgi:hypothetical protein